MRLDEIYKQQAEDDGSPSERTAATMQCDFSFAHDPRNSAAFEQLMQMPQFAQELEPLVAQAIRQAVLNFTKMLKNQQPGSDWVDELQTEISIR